MVFAKAILESPYKVLQGTWRTTILKRPIHFFIGRSIFNYFKRLSCCNFLTLLRKIVKPDFLETEF